ncbi:hypothetical protein FRB94_014343 [Tulasnella sp. JGI-2019a]|nr:hypothetical protein FRB93_008629 [Tulasnella sp. JGI-2019a]KAG9007488.1 hypothetical protein FRB94_014343 [Tulasnella sp. JGI-2019a]
MTLLIESHIFDPRPVSPLQVTAKRYSWFNPPSSGGSSSSSFQERYTLVCFHAGGFTKECWEPVLEALFSRVATCGQNAPFTIDEAWAIDCQNHGEAAALNADALRSLPAYKNGYFQTTEWADGTYQFLRAKTRIDQKRGRKFIGVGHSIGAVTLLHLAQCHPTLFSSVTIFDPILHPFSFEKECMASCSMYVALGYTRRDVWPSKQAALKDLQKNRMFKTWDPRQLELYVEHGLDDHPGGNYAPKYKGVTLKCTREQETATFRGGPALRRHVLPKLMWLTDTIPVYICFGENADFIPRPVQDALVDPSHANFVQVTMIPNAGHLVIVQRPAACGEMLFEFLQHLTLNVVSTDTGSITVQAQRQDTSPEGRIHSSATSRDTGHVDRTAQMARL